MATTLDTEAQNLQEGDRGMKFSDVVKFEVKYPADYKKKKHLKDGDVIELHKLQADDWVERKLGKIVK